MIEVLAAVLGLVSLLAAAWALKQTASVSAWRSSAEAWEKEKLAAVSEASRLSRMLTYEREEVRALRLENRHLYNRTDLTPLLEKQTETQEQLGKYIATSERSTRSLTRVLGEIARALKVQTDENGETP